MVFSKMGKMLALVVIAAAFAGCQQQAAKPADKMAGDDNGPMTLPWGNGACKNVVYFDFDKSDIKAEAKDCLTQGGAYLKANASTKVNVEGHADERGTPEYNMALGERRAKAVAEALTAAGAAATQLETVSYGEEKPAAEGHDEAAWSQNRRAVLNVSK